MKTYFVRRNIVCLEELYIDAESEADAIRLAQEEGFDVFDNHGYRVFSKVLSVEKIKEV